MEEKKYVEPQQIEEEYDEIDIMELLRKLFKEWKLILKWCGIAAVVGLVFAFSVPRQYTVTTKLASEGSAKGVSGNLGSLASLAGISLGSVSGTDAVSPGLYPDIISSTPFVVELFPVQVDFTAKKQEMKADYYTYLKEYTRVPWWRKVIGFPMQAFHWFIGLFHEKGEVSSDGGYAQLNLSELTGEQAGIAGAIRSNISIEQDKKTSLINLAVTAQDPKVAVQISEEVISRLQTYVTNYRTEKARLDVEYFEMLYNESKDAYFKSQQQYASYMDRNQGVVLQRVKTEQERLQNEMNLNFQLYNACAQQLQAAKAKVQQETPVFTVINPPQMPQKSSNTPKKTILVASLLLGAVVAAIWILWGRDTLASFKKKDDEEEAEKAEKAEKAPAKS